MKQYLGFANTYLEGDSSANVTITASNNIVLNSTGVKFRNALQSEINSFDDTQIAVVATSGEIEWMTPQTFTGGLSMGGRLHTGTGANVASATVITLGNDGNYFPITGTTAVTGIVETNWNDGDTIILYSVAGFDITADASPLTGLPIKLVGGSQTIAAGDIVRLTLADGFWRGRLDNF